MTTLQRDYFRWLVRQTNSREYDQLLYLLHTIPFEYSLPMDGNRDEDGISLRYAFAVEKHLNESYVASELDQKPCSVLEMLVALASRCETDLMAAPGQGDRSYIWFWEMVDNLHLVAIYRNYPENYKEKVRTAVQNFLDRNYSRNGNGNIFIIPNSPTDLRNVEIWAQMNLYYMERV